MTRIALAAGAAAFFALSSLASAEEMTGRIVSVNTAEGTVMLDSGGPFILPAATDPKSLQVGQEVLIVYVETNGQMIASRIGNRQ